MKKLIRLGATILIILVCLGLGIYLGSTDLISLKFVANKPIIKVPLNTQTIACGSQFIDPIIKELRKVAPGIRLEEAPKHTEEFDYPALKWRDKMEDGTDVYFVYPIEKAHFINSKKLDKNEVEEQIVRPIQTFLRENEYLIPENFDIPAFGWEDGTFTRRFGFTKSTVFENAEPSLTQNIKMVIDISEVPIYTVEQFDLGSKELLIGLTCASTFDTRENGVENLDDVYAKFKKFAKVHNDTTIEYFAKDLNSEEVTIYPFNVIPLGGRMTDGFREFWQFSEDGKANMIEKLRMSVDCDLLSKYNLEAKCYDQKGQRFK